MRLAEQPEIFPETRWSLILRIRSGANEDSSREALNDLCRAYWQPLYVYLRRSGHEAEAAKDIVQGFLTHFLSCDGFGRMLPVSGRFRYFLLGSLRNYVVSQGRKEGALKRGGSTKFIPLDVQQAEDAFLSVAGEVASPERAYDRQWAQTVWNRALGRLREEYRGRGKEQLYEALKPALTTGPGEGSPTLAAEAGLSSSALAVAVHRLRRRLRELVLDELCATVEKQADLDDELNYFLSIWAQ